jgi:hypothetical protein
MKLGTSLTILELPKTGPTGCAGCPDDCISCIFAHKGATVAQQTLDQATIIVREDQYGCKHGGAIAQLPGGETGLLRSSRFHELTPEGINFLRKSTNPLVTILSV